MSITEAVSVETGEIVAYRPPSLPARQSPEALAVQAAEIRELQAAVLREGTDFGVIPGTNKPSLYKSGAEWLLRWANFGHRLDPVEVERDDLGRKFGVTYRCTVFALGQPDVVVATCDGYAGYDEDRFYKSQAELEAQERANAERYQRRVNPTKFATEYRAPWNSVLKMAEKRALVGATLQATATSGLFTQDMEDHQADGVAAEDRWFVERGWAGKAEHDAERAALLALLKGDKITDAQRDEFKAWQQENDYGLNRANDRDSMDAMKAKAAELAGVEPAVIPDGGEYADEGEPPAEAKADPMDAIVSTVHDLALDDVDDQLRQRGAEPEGNADKRRMLLTGLLYEQQTGADLGLRYTPFSAPEEASGGGSPSGDAAAPEAATGAPEDGDSVKALDVEGMPRAQVVAELVRRGLDIGGRENLQRERLAAALEAETATQDEDTTS